jgi:hypothetical protein
MSWVQHSLKFALLVVFFALAVPIARAQTQNPFFQPPLYTLYNATVTADFNQDGYPDLVAVGGRVLLGNGDGSFRTGTPLNLNGISPHFIATADFNGDGKPDILIGENNATFAYVFLGKGDGTFQAPIATNLGTTLYEVSAADVNGDGKADMLALTPSGGSTGLWEFIGKGDGTFEPGVLIANVTVDYSYPLLLGDFNGDGKPDIVIGDDFLGGIDVFLNNGNGTFQSPVFTPTSLYNAAKLSGDFNGDHKLDLIVNNGSGEAVTLLGNGDGTFQSPIVALPSGGGSYFDAAADLNGDGKCDLVLDSSFYSGGAFAEIFLSNGDGTFTLGESYLQVAPNPSSFLVADFNNDHKPDLAARGEILLGNGDGTFRGNRANIITSSTHSLSAASGDFNGDGSPDVAALGDGGPYIFLNDGTGNLSLAYSTGVGGQAMGTPIVDVNGDGKLDLVFLGNYPTLFLMLGNGDGSFGSPTTIYQGSLAPPVLLGDFNGDHHPDIAVLLNGEIAIFLNNGDGTFASPVSYFGGLNPTMFVIGDFNNDGKLDIVDASSAGLGLLLGNGDGTFEPAVFFTSDNFYAVRAAADLNHDGNLDLIAAISTGQGQANLLNVLLGKGNGTFDILPPTNLPGEDDFFGLTSMSAADVNGDGIPDIVWAGTQQIYGGEAGQIQVALGNGDGTFGNLIPLYPLQFAGTGFALLTDLNHDGKPDAVANVDNAVVTMLNVTQPGFAMAASPLSPGTVTAGGSATSKVNVASLWGFKGSVSLSCSSITLNGAPATNAPPTCSFSPGTVPNGSGTSMLTVNTTGSAAMLSPGATRHPILAYAMWLPIAGMTLLGAGLPFGTRKKKFLAVLLVCLMLSGMIFLVNCGGGSSSSGGQGGRGQGGGGSATPAGTYTITVKGAGQSETNTATLTLTVQ